MNAHIPYEKLIEFTEQVLKKGFNYSEAEARVTAKVLVEADARGIPSHGVARLAFYRQNLERGFAHPGAEPEIVWSTPSSLVVDGHGGVGCYVAEFGVQTPRADYNIHSSLYFIGRGMRHDFTVYQQ